MTVRLPYPAAVLLDTVATLGPITRADAILVSQINIGPIAAETAWTKLAAAGFVESVGPLRVPGARGRPPHLFVTSDEGLDAICAWRAERLDTTVAKAISRRDR